jgi:hypothetical protein
MARTGSRDARDSDGRDSPSAVGCGQFLGLFDRTERRAGAGLCLRTVQAPGSGEGGGKQAGMANEPPFRETPPHCCPPGHRPPCAATWSEIWIVLLSLPKWTVRGVFGWVFEWRSTLQPLMRQSTRQWFTDKVDLFMGVSSCRNVGLRVSKQTLRQPRRQPARQQLRRIWGTNIWGNAMELGTSQDVFGRIPCHAVTGKQPFRPECQLRSQVTTWARPSRPGIEPMPILGLPLGGLLLRRSEFRPNHSHWGQ